MSEMELLIDSFEKIYKVKDNTGCISFSEFFSNGYF